MTERWTSTLSSVADEPMTQGLLERAKEGPRLAPPGPTAGRRVAVAVVALAIGLVAVLIAVKSIEGTGTVPSNQITESQYGWSATVPEGWTVTPYRVSFLQPPDNSPAPSGNTGLAFSNFELQGTPEDYALARETVPADGALLLVDGGASTIQVSEHGDEMFPIQLQDGSGGIARSGGFVANGMHYEVLVFEGDAVDDEAGGQIDAIVASIQFPEAPDPLPGQAVEFEPGVISLGAPDRYPLRSLTALTIYGPTMQDQSIVLVHAPRGFYALRGVWGEPCALEWHPSSGSITGCDAHPGPWNKFGRRIPGTGARFPLEPLLVGINFDGRLLTQAYSSASLDTRSAWNRR